ncbi:acyl carrier protein [Brevibacterium luteolum]|uniref:acyl carrier protein n=1 Tax=Brevibacterium luteolum TaxID=199591 RepID=UPI001479373B|nr:acyl carrier protein [Brevibacterium luteolum]MBM7529388.1 acyl carrier protein [Brevibacterium luteolum]
MPHVNVTEEKLRSVVFEILDDASGVENADLNSNLDDVGVDSLGLTELIVEIETRLDLGEELDSKLNGLDRTGILGTLIEHLHGVINSLPAPTS